MAPDEPIASAVRDWPDISYHCRVEVHSHWMDLKVYEADFNNGTVAFERRGATHSLDTTQDVEQAQVFLSGSVKWDGCSNLRFDAQDHVMLHFCGKEAAVNIGVLLGRLYDLAAELVPAWDG